MPECAVLLVEVVPDAVQPERVPVSKPPLVIPPPPPVDETVTVTDVLWVTLPSVPFTVTVYVPAATDEPAETVRVEELPAVTDVAESETVGPEGETLATRLTVPAEPLATEVLMVEVPLPPGANDRVAGVALIEKSFVVEPPTIVCDISHRLVSFDQVDCMA